MPSGIVKTRWRDSSRALRERFRARKNTLLRKAYELECLPGDTEILVLVRRNTLYHVYNTHGSRAPGGLDLSQVVSLCIQTIYVQLSANERYVKLDKCYPPARVVGPEYFQSTGVEGSSEEDDDEEVDEEISTTQQSCTPSARRDSNQKSALSRPANRGKERKLEPNTSQSTMLDKTGEPTCILVPPPPVLLASPTVVGTAWRSTGAVTGYLPHRLTSNGEYWL